MGVILIIDHSAGCGGGQVSLMNFIEKNLSLHRNLHLLISKKNVRLFEFCKSLNIDVTQFDFEAVFIIRLVKIVKVFIKLKYLYSIKLVYGNTFEGGVWSAVFKVVFKAKFIFRARLSIVDFKHGYIDFFISYFADLILANSFYVKQGFLLRFGSSYDTKTVVVYNSVELRGIAKIRSCNLDSFRYFHVGVIGELASHKRQLFAIKAFKELTCLYPSALIKFFIVGEDKNDGSYIESCRRYVAEVNLTDMVFFTGYVGLENIVSNLDLVVNCGDSEALSRVVYETQNFGIPNIVSNKGGNFEIIEDGVNGVVFNSSEVSSLVKAIWNIYADQEFYNKLSLSSVISVREKFSLANTSMKEAELIQSLLS